MSEQAAMMQAHPHWLPEKGRDPVAHIPGEDGVPLFGTTLEQLRDPMAFTRRMVAKYGKVFRTHSFGAYNVGLLGPEANELMLFDRDKIFSSEQGWGPVLWRLFPRGLMLLDFDHHRMDRRTLSVAFKPEPMRNYADALNTGIQTRIAEWSGKSFQFYPAIKQLTLDLAATSFLGIPWGPEADKINKSFVDMVAASVGIARTPLPFTKMAKGVAGRKYMSDFFARAIPERRKAERTDIFTQICHARDENGNLLSDQAIIDHMNFLMMAAHDTITSSVTTMVMLLGKNPEWQDKLRAEMLGVAEAGRPIDHNALPQLELTEMAFKESLRLIPPVPIMPRRALKDFEFGGYTIPAGTHVGVNTSYTHMMPEYWPNPDKFDPMRFTPDQVRDRHKYAWVPFGGGAHMCLGLHFAYMQSKIFFHHLLTTHRIVLAEGYDPAWQAWPIPKPKDGLHIRLEKL